jgi:alkyl hydroperoxide reductase subunit AhpF
MAGGGNSALQEAILLSEKCKEVIILQDLPFLTGEPSLQKVLAAKNNVRCMTEVKITKLLKQNDAFCGVEIEHNGEKQTVACDGLFVAIGLIPENDAFAQLADLNAYGYFDSDEQCVTKTPGIFVAGDCRRKNVRQLTTAVADGATAALAACRLTRWRMLRIFRCVRAARWASPLCSIVGLCGVRKCRLCFCSRSLPIPPCRFCGCIFAHKRYTFSKVLSGCIS